MSNTRVGLAAMMLVMALMTGGCQSSDAAGPSPAQAQAQAALNPPAAGQRKPAATPVAASVPSAPQAKPEGAPGVLACDQPIYDIGQADPRLTIKGSFTLKNSGAGVLEIDKNIHTDCTCTVVSLDKYTLKPGETAELKSELHLSEFPGPVDKGITVVNLHDPNNKLRMAFKGAVKKILAVSPEKFEFEARDTARNRAPLVIESTDNTPFKVTAINVPGSAIKFVFDPHHAAVRHEIPVEVNTKSLLQFPFASLTITVDHPKAKTAVLQYTTLLPFRNEPGSVYFQEMQPGQAQIQNVRVISNYREKFKITGIRAVNKKVEISRKPHLLENGDYEFEVSMKAPLEGQSPAIFDRILLDVEGYGPNAVTVPCFGRLKINNMPYGAH